MKTLNSNRGLARRLLLSACLIALAAGCDKPKDAGVANTEETTAVTVDAAPVAIGQLSELASGANIAGANGIYFGPDGRLYAASVVGSNITIMDPNTGEILQRLGAAEGVFGPDDLAFAADGSFFWTSILTGEVAGFNAAGERVVAAQLTPGVNPITFSDDGRLFVSQCFFGTGLFEVDPLGVNPPRTIAADLGPGCGLNGMDWGPDGRLYGPRWFTGEVVSFNVDDNTMRVEASGLQTPAAVKFNSRGELFVLDTGTGEVFKVTDNVKTLVATLTPGLDNFAFDKTDRLYVSSFTDGFIKRVEADGSLTSIQPGGLSHPGGMAWAGKQLAVADLHAIRFFDPSNGAELRVHRNVLGVGEVGGAINLAADGDNLILVSWVDNDVRVWDPASGKILERYSNLQAPVAAVRYAGQLLATEHGTNRVISLAADGVRGVFAMTSPSGLVVHAGALYVTDRESGSVYQLGANNQLLAAPQQVITGLVTPEGIASLGADFVIVEGATGHIKRVTLDGAQTLLATIPAGTPAPGPAQPPSMVFNGVAVGPDGTIYATGETSRKLYTITESLGSE
ncbi:MAG: hypothetical protein NWR61_05650 [Pseudomonadales bacterium]|nr:hypothetical protein [Pseudomonadales bacterium]MDP4765814.1 hypothetical protein [Pseudomonadales bacterium]MDP4875689.1 hypothetical protein [Pseudomonadales bacterium]MDP4912569.1 hypothetical protein [Pseudomonadales bacterium]MDP5058557.1 hypothetical protein [Pseudomonadales bacterium]